MKPLAPSRGFAVEAGHEDRARADACCAEFRRRVDAREKARVEALRQSRVIPHERGEE